MRHWTTTDEKQLIARFERGDSIGEIAAALERSRGAITARLHQYRKRHGRRALHRGREWSADSCARLVLLYNELVPVKRLAVLFERNVSAINGQLKRLRDAGAPIIWRRKAWTAAEDAKMRAWRDSGKPWAFIAVQLGRSEAACSKQYNAK